MNEQKSPRGLRETGGLAAEQMVNLLFQVSLG